MARIIVLMLLLSGCIGGLEPSKIKSVDGLVAIPLKLDNLNLTVCMKKVLDEYHCFETETKKVYVLSNEQFKKIDSEFVLVHSEQLLATIEQKRYLRDTIQHLYYGDPESLEVLKEFLYTSD